MTVSRVEFEESGCKYFILILVRACTLSTRRQESRLAEKL